MREVVDLALYLVGQIAMGWAVAMALGFVSAATVLMIKAMI